MVDGCGFYAEGMSFETEEKFIFFPSAVVDQIVQGNVDLPVANAILKVILINEVLFINLY